MADWLDALAKDWGHWQRRHEAKAGCVAGTLGRIREEGLDGAAIREFGQRLPYRDWPLRVNQFHRAWLSLEEHEQAAIWLQFRIRKPRHEKLRLMGMKKTAYYRLIERALHKVSMYITQSPESPDI